MPAVSVIIPTYNRKWFWQTRRLLDALLGQTATDFEVVIVDDASTDGTGAWLYWQLRQQDKFSFRIYRTTADKQLATQASALPDNVLFANARSPVVAHLDDDCWIGPRYVEYLIGRDLARQPAVWYAAQTFIEPATGAVWRGDWRVKKFIPAVADHVQITPEMKCAWGAAYAAPLAVIRELGGHDMAIAPFRGQDARLGVRLQQKIPLYLSNHPAMQVNHWGRSWWAEMEIAGRMTEVRDVARSPNLGYHEELVVNGGAAFWDSNQLDPFYYEVT